MSDAIVAPASLLLATDLSARGDRAFDRAVQLARQWRARLVIATVLPSLQELDFHDPIFGTPPWQRPALLASRLTDADREAHRAFIATLGDKPVWNEYLAASQGA